MSELAERLGYNADDRLFILTCDNLGRTHAGNVAAYQALREGLATSATLMIPAPWSRAAAKAYRGEDVGVHLTLNAELDLYRWGPITHAPSLLDGDGGFPRTVADLWEHADTEEVRRECRAQIERAILWGFEVTHLDSHMGAMIQRPEFFDVYLDLALEFRLPMRLDADESQSTAGFPFRNLAREENVLFPDYVTSVGAGEPHSRLIDILNDLESGVTEICIQPAIDTPELRELDPLWQRRVAAHDALSNDASLLAIVTQIRAKPIGYRELRAIQQHAS